MKVYSISDVAEHFDLKPTTIRKYAVMFEEQGHHFKRNSRNQRYFDDTDVIMLQQVIQSKHTGMTLQESISGAIQLDNHVTATDATNDLVSHDEDRIDELKDMILQQNEMIQSLSDELADHKRFINESINKRDQNIMQLMNDMSEQKQIAATEEDNESKKEKGFFAKLFGK